MKWRKDDNGDPRPIYTDGEAQQIAELAWNVQFILPHPDDALPGEATLIRNFNRVLQGLRPLPVGRPEAATGGER